jgi:hypothetical protein
MKGIYTYIPETNCVPREYRVAAILLFLFMVHISLAPVLKILTFSIPMCVCNINIKFERKKHLLTYFDFCSSDVCYNKFIDCYTVQNFLSI